MHNSVIKAREYRARENQRRLHNIRKQQARQFVIMCGLNPAFTPSHPEGTRSERRAKIRPELRARRFARNIVKVVFWNVA